MAFAGLAAFTVFLTSWGLTQLEQHVHGLERYDKSVVAIEWQDLPDFLRATDNRHILDYVRSRIDLRTNDRILDPQLAERIGASLMRDEPPKYPAIGWVKSVDRVVVRPDGVVSIKCQFREPKAFIQHGAICYLVDDEGAVLPGTYSPEDCATSKLLLISGVRNSPPSIGRIWPGDDIKSGLKLASLIADRKFRNQVDRIILTNFDGRVDRKRPHIELATNRPGSRVWWGLPPSREDGTETTTDQKLALLDLLYQEYGRIDLGRAYVDIRTHPNSVSIAKDTQTAARQ